MAGTVALGGGSAALARRATGALSKLAPVARLSSTSRAGRVLVNGAAGATTNGAEAAFSKGATWESVLALTVAGGIFPGPADDLSKLRRAARAGDDHAIAAVKVGDDALVVRGGTNTPDRFAGGSGVTVDDAGNLHGISATSAPGRTLEELTQGIPNRQVGVTTVGDIRAAGGYVRPDPTPNNPYHCLIGGCSAEQFSQLFTPTIKNPWK